MDLQLGGRITHVHPCAQIRPHTTDQVGALGVVILPDRRQPRIDQVSVLAEQIEDLAEQHGRPRLFSGSLVGDSALVVAMGSHEPDARETDDVLAERGTVYVEDVDTALREAGDVRIAVDNGSLSVDELNTLGSLVNHGAVSSAGPVFYKTVGMGWQDLAVAQVAYGAQG